MYKKYKHSFSPKYIELPFSKVITNIFYLFFYLLILCSPLVIYGVSLGGMSLRFSRLMLFLITPFLFFKISFKPSLIFRDNFLIFIILPYLLYTTISGSWSPSVETGTVSQRLGGLYEILYIYMICIVADINIFRFRFFVKVYLLSALIPVGVGFWQIANNILNFSMSEVPFDKFLIAGKYDLLEGRVFISADGVSRISSTFAEPTIFGNFITSVLLFSFFLTIKNSILNAIFRLYQISLFTILILSLSKLAIICFVFGFGLISIRDKNFNILPFIFIISFVFIGVIYYYDLFFMFDRLFMNTGHAEILEESIDAMSKADLFFGEGIGSIPFGSYHRFVISRVYECGIIGLIFVIAVTALPFTLVFQKTIYNNSIHIKNISISVLSSVILGLNLYDFFIHVYPWIIIGAIMSFSNGAIFCQAKRNLEECLW